MSTDPSPVEGQEPEDKSVVAPADPSADVSDANDPAPSSSVDGAEPTEGSPDAKPSTLLEAVEQVLSKDEAGGADPSTAEGSSEKTDADAKDEDEKSEGEDDGKGDEDPPFHEHPRWKQLVSERDELKTRAEEAEEAAEAVTRISSYLDDQNLSVDEFNKLLHIGALMKNDPVSALEALTPYYTRLQEVTGYVLPADLQQRVEAGYLTEDDARQIAQSKAQAAITQFRADTQVQRTEQQRVQEQQTQRADSVGTAASEWERQWQASDPDYPKKAARVKDWIELAIAREQEAVPNTEDEVLALCKKARQAVEAELRSFLPKPQPKAVNNPASAPGGAATASAPSSVLDVIDRTLGAG